MTVLAKAAALLIAASPSDLDGMSPADRRRLADLLWHWHRVVERRERYDALLRTVRPAPKSGVLASLHDGERAL